MKKIGLKGIGQFTSKPQLVVRRVMGVRDSGCNEWTGKSMSKSMNDMAKDYLLINHSSSEM